MQNIDQKSEPIAQVILAYLLTNPKTPSTVNKVARSLLGESYKFTLTQPTPDKPHKKNGPS